MASSSRASHGSIVARKGRTGHPGSFTTVHSPGPGMDTVHRPWPVPRFAAAPRCRLRCCASRFSGPWTSSCSCSARRVVSGRSRRWTSLSTARRAPTLCAEPTAGWSGHAHEPRQRLGLVGGGRGGRRAMGHAARRANRPSGRRPGWYWDPGRSRWVACWWESGFAPWPHAPRLARREAEETEAEQFLEQVLLVSRTDRRWSGWSTARCRPGSDRWRGGWIS
jgi:hypothetical protein